MKSAFKILTATSVAGALVVGGLVGAMPAEAAAPAVGVDISQAPAVLSIPKTGCVEVPFTATITGGTPDGIYSIDGSLSNGAGYPITIGNNTPTAGYDVPNVPQAMYAYLCSNLVYAGNQTLTITVQDYENEDAAGNPALVSASKVVLLHASTADLSRISGSGTKGHKLTFKATTGLNVIGAKAKFYFKAKGSKKYKYVGKATIHTDKTFGGKVTFKKKLGAGAIYFKTPKSAKVVAGKSKVFKYNFHII